MPKSCSLIGFEGLQRNKVVRFVRAKLFH